MQALEEGQRRLAYARSRSVMIATPVSRAPVFAYTLSYGETCAHLTRLGITFATQFVIGSANLPAARNELAARFLASGLDDLIYIDDDMGWRAEDLVRLLASDKPVIGGVGRKRVEAPDSDPAVWCVLFEDGAEHGLVQDDSGAVRVRRAGTGFLKVSRCVFEAMMSEHPEWKRNGRRGWPGPVTEFYYEFFTFAVSGGEEMGEDYTFCERWRALGGEIWIDPSIALIHTGQKDYTGCISEILVHHPEEARSAITKDEEARSAITKDEEARRRISIPSS